MGAAYSGFLGGIFLFTLGIVEGIFGGAIVGLALAILSGVFISFGRKRDL
jgi:hypothetical protein